MIRNLHAHYILCFEGLSLLGFFQLRNYFLGAYDDLQTAGGRLMKIFKQYDLLERKIVINHPDKPIIVQQQGFWINVDEAFGVLYMPFFHMAYNQKETMNVEPAPIFDFHLFSQ